jgi:outer membrane immunogenic protein
MITRIALGALVLFGFTGAAAAADLPTKKAPPPPPPATVSWAGFYLGVQVGGGWMTDQLSETTSIVPPLTGHASLNGAGVIGGAHAGYNWQAGSFVYGIEGDFEGTSLGRNSRCIIEDAGAGNTAPGSCFPSTLNYSYGTSLPWQSSARARLGYAFDDVLLYATGGVAFADIATHYSQSGVTALGIGSQSFNQARVGFTVGAGVEYAFTANWSARVEYRFSDFSKAANSITSAGVFWNGYTDHHGVEENAVMFGLSYKL